MVGADGASGGETERSGLARATDEAATMEDEGEGEVKIGGVNRGKDGEMGEKKDERR